MITAELEQSWRSRLQECGNEQVQTSIIRWLLGETPFEELEPQQVKVAQQAMEHRYRILRQRYLGVNSAQAYRHLLNRLGSLTVLRSKIYRWVALSRDRQRALADVLEEVIQEMLKRDRYLQQQITCIAQYTQCLSVHERRLRDSLLLATIEEYCLRPVRNQPLIVYRFVNYLRRQERGGITQVPRQAIVRTISEDDNSVSRLDLAPSTEREHWEEQAMRLQVQQEFERYLVQHLGETAVQWLRLYLQGHSPEVISQALQLSVQDIYRLREKVSYHALQVATKVEPELIASWLKTSLQDDNLGLTQAQWQKYCQSLTSAQHQLLKSLKLGTSIEKAAQELDWRTSKTVSEWSKLYQQAQHLRNASSKP